MVLLICGLRSLVLYRLTVSQLVTHDHTSTTVVHGERVAQVKERGLQDTSREDHLVLGGVVVSVDGRRSHFPFVTVSGLLQLVQVAQEAVSVGVQDIDKEVVGLNGNFGVVARVVGVTNHVGNQRQLGQGLVSGLVVHPVKRVQVLVHGVFNRLNHLGSNSLAGTREGTLNEVFAQKFAERGVSGTNADSVTRGQLLLARKNLAKEVEVLVDEGLRTIGSNRVDQLPT